VNETQAAPSLDFGAAQIEPVLLDDAELDQALNLDFAFQQEEVVAAVPDFDTQSSLDDLDLGLGDAAAAADFAVDDPVQTKIDLARAYVDMGDAEGAREILQEAMQEGSPAQQEVARGMLATL
jgi:pilus assembly protein FimV